MERKGAFGAAQDGIIAPSPVATRAPTASAYFSIVSRVGRA